MPLKPASKSALRWLETDRYYAAQYQKLKSSELAPVISAASIRTIVFLLNANILSRGEFQQLTRYQVLQYPNVGKQTLDELQTLLGHPAIPQLHEGDTIPFEKDFQLRIVARLPGQHRFEAIMEHKEFAQ